MCFQQLYHKPSKNRFWFHECIYSHMLQRQNVFALTIVYCSGLFRPICLMWIPVMLYISKIFVYFVWNKIKRRVTGMAITKQHSSVFPEFRGLTDSAMASKTSQLNHYNQRHYQIKFLGVWWVLRLLTRFICDTKLQSYLLQCWLLPLFIIKLSIFFPWRSTQ